MTEIWLVSTPSGRQVMVEEFEYYRFLLAAKSLVIAQRAALRTKDKRSIAACKARERALLDMVTQYEAYRSSIFKPAAS